MAALRGKVLLLDSQARHRRLTSAMLTELGLEVSNTNDAASAVALALTGHFELLLIDLTIPFLDGIDASATLRAAGYARPIVALTAALVAAEQRHYLARGFSHCLIKPLDSGALASQLGSLLAPGGVASATAGAPPVLLDMAVLCALFAARLPVQVQQMQALAARHEWRAVSRIAHFVKGAGASFDHGAEGELAARLDAAISKGEHALAQAALNRLAERIGLAP
ncbi:Hpt domain-containing response regulator [Massilia sp. PWRC2]|uniref:Hpt domain-containing response regulator n=1 Tax=Massilia sp. PWRC2 TaxID=2804626 RepID=UPI003CFBB570